MAQNNNQQQKESYQKEDAYQSLEMINTWINNIDTKVSFALALVGVLIGMVFGAGTPKALQRISEVSKLAELSGGEILAAILVCLLYIASLLSIVSFMLVIMARVKNLNNAPSMFFFGSIAKMTLQNYKDKVNQLTEKQIVEDLEEQIHTNSKICSQKAKWYNIGIRFLASTIILWFICMVFRLI
jgi:ABC-type multidrug transport system fused ATPase/permease subunit